MRNSEVLPAFMSHQRMSGRSSPAIQARTFSFQSPQVTGMRSHSKLNFSQSHWSLADTPDFSASSMLMEMVSLSA